MISLHRWISSRYLTLEMEKCQLCQSIVLDALTNSVDKTLSSQGKDGGGWWVGWVV